MRAGLVKDMLPKRVELSVLLPMYNEATRIERCVKDVERAVKQFSKSYEIIIAEDGSNDGTEAIAARLVKCNSTLRLLHSDVRLGKGRAIRYAFRIAMGDIIVFLDTDLATDLEYLPRIVKVATQNRGMVIGSRHISGSNVSSPVSRKLFSLAYNLLVRMLFHDGVYDHQCGFKAMDRELVEMLKDRIEANGFLFDTEMIVRARQLGYRITEIGVKWSEPREKGESKVTPFRDALKMALGLLKLRLYMNINHG